MPSPATKTSRSVFLLLVVASFVVAPEAAAFAPASLPRSAASVSKGSRRHVLQCPSPHAGRRLRPLPVAPLLRPRPSASLAMVPSIIRSILPGSPLRFGWRLSALIGATLILATNLRRILWPGSSRDQSRVEPLPPGSFGCPFLGMPFFQGSKAFGSGYFYHRVSNILGNPRVWKYYFMGKPFAVVSGGKDLKGVLNQEFDGVTTGGVDLMSGGLMPMDSLMFETDRGQHSFLRRLVGSALTPAAVSQAVPTLQAAAEEQVERIVRSSGPVRMEDVCTDYALDVAWRQILGLDLTDEEIPVFQRAVDEWIKGVMSLRILFRIAVKSSPGYAAMSYVISKIDDKIRDLERNGPDSSTLSGMLFATDEEDKSRRLTRQQLIDNALILIFAGSETSATTLTNAMLFLGLHPGVWQELVEEQRVMQVKHGSELSKEALDSECPYLEAVIKETMRMRAITGGIPRLATDTIIVDGKQVPKGWLIDPSMLLTHELDPTTYKEDGSHMDPRRGFEPERWLSDETSPSADFMPFGAGPRYCLGSNLAMGEMKVFLAVLARSINFELNETENIEWDPGMNVIAKPADGVLVTASAKDNNMVGV